MVQALSIHRKWKGYTFDYEGSQKLVFSLKEPNFSCLVRKNAIRVSTEPRRSNKDWDFEIKGYFPDRSCSIVDSLGNIVAQVCDLYMFHNWYRDHFMGKWHVLSVIVIFFFFFFMVNFFSYTIFSFYRFFPLTYNYVKDT